MQAERLREQIATLNEQLAVIDTELADLATTRTTLLRLADVTDRSTDGTPPPTDATTASPAYQQILAMFTTTGNPLRAKEICHAIGTGTAAPEPRL